jgi:hemoglobin
MTELTKKHIENLVTHFYQRVQKDELLGHIFNDIAHVDFAEHIPVLCHFWNSIMLKTSEYHGNAYEKHVFIGQKTNIQKAHFIRWLDLFQQESVKHLPAKAAEEIIQKASLIAKSLQHGMCEPSLIHEVL